MSPLVLVVVAIVAIVAIVVIVVIVVIVFIVVRCVTHTTRPPVHRIHKRAPTAGPVVVRVGNITLLLVLVLL